MRPRFLGELGAADAVSLSNAVLGFLAVAIAFEKPMLAARLVLLGAIADGVDGVIARRRGGTPVGEYLDSLSDVVTFGVAPAMLIAGSVASSQQFTEPTEQGVAAVIVAALFLAAVIVRLGIYTAYDTAADRTKGAQSTLAGTIVAAVVLTGIGGPGTVLVIGVVLAWLMTTTIEYPDLLARDAMLMGVVQGIAVLFPRAVGRAFPYAILVLALAYLVLAPRFYWRALD